MAEIGDISELKARVREQRDEGDPAGTAGVLRDAIRRIGPELADLHGMPQARCPSKGTSRPPPLSTTPASSWIVASGR